MTKTGYAHATLVVDRSGSMSVIREDAEGGVNTYIEDQKKIPGDFTLTLYDFDTEFRKFIGPKAIADVGTYKLIPRGGTALLDAIGRAIVETGEWLAGTREVDRPERVAVVIITDGGENSSKEYTRKQVQELIKQQTDKYQWEFLFLSSDLSAVQDAQSLGIDKSFAVASAGSQTYNSLSHATTLYRGGATMDWNPNK